MRRLLAIVPACAVLLAACGGGNDDDLTPPATPTIDANRLVGTEWVLVDLAGGGVISGVEATLQFQDLTRMGGNGSCNSFGANVRISGHAITVTDTMQTLIACEDDVAAQELHYMEALRKAERFAFDGDDLLIHASGFEAPLRFRPRTDASAAGTWETLPPLAAGIRQETAVVTLDDEVVVIGGFGANNSAQARVEAYNPSSRQWRRLPDLPVGMHHTNAAVVDGSIYIVGFLTGGNFAPDGRVFILRPARASGAPGR
jgi:putative lipoprotein